LRSTKRVWGIGPSTESTSSSTPSHMLSTRSTSPPKSAWPGVSMMLTLTPLYLRARAGERAGERVGGRGGSALGGARRIAPRRTGPAPPAGSTRRGGGGGGGGAAGCQEPHLTAVFLARMVMPRSRSRSLLSITLSVMAWFSRNTFDWRSSWSTSVVLP
jgi:hypothetical protein